MAMIPFLTFTLHVTLFYKLYDEIDQAMCVWHSCRILVANISNIFEFGGVQMFDGLHNCLNQADL